MRIYIFILGLSFHLDLSEFLLFNGEQKMVDNKFTRRQVLKAGVISIVAAPIVGFSANSMAAQNAAMRTSLKFQDHPNGDKQCSKCVNWLPTADLTKPGGCKLYPGDTEIAPNGYCMAFAPKKA